MWRLALCLTMLTACAQGGGRACEADGDCSQGFACNGGQCLCVTDDACGVGLRCNPYGHCQHRPACLGNADCDQGFLCNGLSAQGGTCIPDGTCGGGAHCPFNQYCEVAPGKDFGVCVTGCKSSGDCELGLVCSGGLCVSGDCSTCPTSPEPDEAYCDYGEFCSAAGECVGTSATAGLCESCAGSDRCSNPGHACLIDPESCSCVDGRCYPNGGACTTSSDCGGACQTEYCAPTCDADADCPNGFGDCGGLIIPCGTCTASSGCANGGACLFSSESDIGICSCLNQEDCALPTGVCDTWYGTCLWGCSTNADCAMFGVTCNSYFGVCNLDCSSDSDCICAQGRCYNTGLPCATAADCALTYTQHDTGSGARYGICETNAGVCGKDPGILCEDMQDGAPCNDL